MILAANELKHNRLEVFISKYFNKLVYYDLEAKQILEQRPMGALPKTVICFDSQLEFEIFKAIKEYFLIEHINVHFKVELKPKTQYSMSMNYFVDFRVKVTDGDFLYIEAKGLITKEASIKIKMLEIVRPDIRSNLIIVSQKEQHYFGSQHPPSRTIKYLRELLSIL